MKIPYQINLLTDQIRKAGNLVPKQKVSKSQSKVVLSESSFDTEKGDGFDCKSDSENSILKQKQYTLYALFA